ncbi:TRAP transporter small permease [Phaeovulum sp.]|uniref:TRAP transporter small permease n=1 Tax=Phaeovulum sp. TaxID=2934796 RepID=UPI0039E28E61
MERLAQAMALAGGAVLLAMIGMICLSVAGNAALTLAQSGMVERWAPGLGAALLAMGVGPLRASYELVELAMAFVVFACLPLVQIRRAHATVAVFTDALPGWMIRRLSAVWQVLMAGAMVLIAWRLGAGMAGKMRSGETTFLLQIPLWWAYAASLFAATVAALVTFWAALKGPWG